ncbi:HEAT repeat-containing protein 1 [Thoreauomyces humboldtii]|nr:HEAT repeat-containing protein 1 [Thoreauomyces humboldtii]
MAATSLAAQLKKLGTTHVPGASKGKASLLFTAKQAADIDVDSLLAIGRTALADLATHNSSFSAFEETLFSETFKTFDRTLQTKEDNAKLDQSVGRFLRLLSPHFLVQSSFRALEWLLRRFRINEFNVDAILECVMPYHETKQFVQVVAILAIEDTSRWAFLRSVQRNKVPLDRTSLVQRLTYDKSVLEFLCTTVASSKQAGVQNRTLWTFFACTIIQYIQDLPAINDEVIRVLLAPLLSLLRIGNPQYADLLATSQMIFAQIANRSPLNAEVVEAIVENAAAGITATNIHSSIIFLLTMYRAQGVETLPALVFAKLAKTSGFEETLVQINTTYEADSLIRPLLTSAVNLIFSNEGTVPSESAEHFVLEILQKAQPSVSTVTHLSTMILNAYLQTRNVSTADSVANSLRGLLAAVQRSYPGVADTLIEKRLRSSTKADQEAIYQFVSETLKNTGSAMVEDSDTTLYLSLQHVESRIRLIALKKLQTMIASNELDTVDYLQDVLLSRLQDDDEEILSLVLGLPNLLSLVDPAHLLPALQRILRASTSSTAIRILTFDLCAQLADSLEGDEATEVKLDLLSCFVLTTPCKELVSHVYSASETGPLKDLVKGSTKLAALLNKAKNSEELAAVWGQSLTVLAANLSKTLAKNVRVYLAGVTSASSDVRILSMLVLVKAMEKKTLEQQLPIAEIVAPLLLAKLRELKDTGKSVGDDILTQAGGLPADRLLRSLASSTDASVTSALESEVVFSALQNLVILLAKPDAEVSWISDEMREVNSIAQSYQRLISHVYSTVGSLGNNKAAETVLINIIELHLGTNTLQFCVALWTNDEASVHLKRHGLTLATAFVAASAAMFTAYDFQLLIPSLLIALGDSDKELRRGAIDCLESMKTHYGQLLSKPKASVKASPTIFAYDRFYGGKTSKTLEYLKTDSAAKLVISLLAGKEELLTDPAFLQQYIQIVLAIPGTKKSGHQEDLMSFLLTNVLGFPRISTQTRLLATLEKVDNAKKVKTLCPLIEAITKQISARVTAPSADLLELMDALLNCFTTLVSETLFTQRSDKYARVFCQMLDSSDTSDSKADTSSGKSMQRLALGRINAVWFAAIPGTRQVEFFSALIRLAYEGDSNVVHDVKQLLRTLPISWELVFAQLQLCQAALQSTDERPAKKAKGTDGTIADAFYRLSTVLELMEYKHDIQGQQNLVGPLFDLLSNLLNSEISEIPVSIEYIKQLIFSVTLSLFQDIKENNLQIDESLLRVDLIVQCIRVTDNPQTHNAALLLMAAIATVYPESVLLNIMPVFTFMGANVLRQDDNFSFHVIQQTLTTVIPPLVEKFRAAGNRVTMLNEVKRIMGVFVDALTHIPKHRRLRLFTVLITTLGASTFLDSIVLMLIAKHSAKNKLPAHGMDGLVDFTLSVVSQFPLKTQLIAVKAMIETVAGLPFEQSETDDEMETEEYGIIDPKACSAKELRQIKLSTLDFVNQLLGSKAFVSRTLASSREEIEDHQMALIQEILMFVTKVNAYQAVNESRGHAVGGKFAVAMNKSLYEALGRANGLLSLASFLRMTSHLMKHDNQAIRRKAMTILDTKVAAIANEIDEATLVLFAPVVEDLRLTLVASQDDKDQEALENKQTALLCLRTMASCMAKADPKTYIPVLQVLVGEEALLNKNAQIVAATLVCLTAICVELGTQVLPFLPKFMPGIVSNLKSALADTATSDTKQLVILGCLGSLDALIDTVAQFVSPYVLPILEQALHPSLLETGEQGVSRRAAEKSSELLSNIAVKVAPRILLPAMFSHLRISLDAGRASMLALFDLVGKAISHMSRNDLAQFRTELFRFFLVSFDYRRSYAGKVADTDIEIIENSIISAFLQLVMKLNETLFKPLFLKMVDWATSELLIKHGLTEEDVNARQLFFYRLVDSMLARLKSIFAPYYAYVLDNSIAKLETYKAKGRTDALWTYIVTSLHKCFLYDNDGLIDFDRFDKLLQPLLSQIDSLDVEDKAYTSNMQKFLVPCIGQLAVTAGKDTLWKPLNHQVLMKTRSEHPEVRLVALKILKELYARLGEEMLILFPETIPFLAELMEDTDGEVEAACQDICSQIQQYIGEDIQQYFTA